MSTFTDALRRRVRARRFRRLNVVEVEQASEALASAIANHAIEGLQLHPEAEAFFATMLEERVPRSLWSSLAVGFAAQFCRSTALELRGK